ncbi:MAG TPA: hypothetical protein VI636_00170 [Candidatus Angelobacter sp.]
MLRKILWVSTFLISLAAFSQVSAPPNQYSAKALPAGYGGTVWTGSGLVGGVLLTTPSSSFPAIANTAGISDGGRAGISNSVPFNSGMPTTAPAGTYVYLPYTTPLGENSGASNAEGASERPTNDLLPSYFTNNVGTPIATGPSLAEIAARYGGGRGVPARQGRQNVRTYTNADVPHENAGMLTKIWVAEGKLPAAAQDSPTLMASAVAPESPAPTSRPATQPQTQSSSSAPGSGQGQAQKLPTSSTFLPLLGLLGLASGGLGLLLRRRALS